VKILAGLVPAATEAMMTLRTVADGFDNLPGFKKMVDFLRRVADDLDRALSNDAPAP
jgi:hypothetical protein